MKPFLALLSSILLCSCADMYVTKTDVAGGSTRTTTSDAKDSKGVYMTTNCGVGAYAPKAIYIRPFCIDTAIFTGDQTNSDGEMPIRKALTPVEFAGVLKESLEKMAPARILKDYETPRTGWLVEGEFKLVDGGSIAGRALFGHFGLGASHLALHVGLRCRRSARDPDRAHRRQHTQRQGELGIRLDTPVARLDHPSQRSSAGCWES